CARHEGRYFDVW
nr:immunoglobulin heavy chain junction region [Mus musculus]MBK4196696.1 immunoglobulin heavy chain junction region [Mus musculus]MBK4196697.1 immunoglobulin heavy chain junction region [Mus musculus]